MEQPSRRLEQATHLLVEGLTAIELLAQAVQMVGEVQVVHPVIALEQV